MKISYDLERKDIFAFQVYASLHNKMLRVIFGGSILLLLYDAFEYPVRVLMSGNAAEAWRFLQLHLLGSVIGIAVSMFFWQSLLL